MNSEYLNVLISARVHSEVVGNDDSGPEDPLWSDLDLECVAAFG